MAVLQPNYVHGDPDPDSEAESQDEEFQIEMILGKRINNGVLEYLCKWQGYGFEDNTWEAATSLQPENGALIAEFEAAQGNQAQ